MPRPWTHEALDAAEAAHDRDSEVGQLVAEVRRLQRALVAVARLGDDRASHLAQKALGLPYAESLLAAVTPRAAELADRLYATDTDTEGTDG